MGHSTGLGYYRPLYARGAKAKHLVAFIRGDAAICLTPRLIAGLRGDWEDTIVKLPDGRWENILTGEDMSGGTVWLREMFARFPVSLLALKE